MQEKDITFNTYSSHSDAYLTKFSLNGVRKSDIDEVFTYTQKQKPHVLEFGCAGGREASYILTKTSNYTGIDYVPSFINEARMQNPSGLFYAEDMKTFTPKRSVDIVLAFASLLHLSQKELTGLLSKTHKYLTKEGLLRISLKEAVLYKEEKVLDSFGDRMFYFYNKETLLTCAREYKVIFIRTEEHAGIPWIEALFQKI